MTANLKQALNSEAADLAVKVIAVVALVLSVLVGVRQVQFTQCLADYNEASNQASSARASAAEQDRLAVDELLRRIGEHPREGIEALREYNEQRTQADEQRRRNPLPAPPSQRCG